MFNRIFLFILLMAGNAFAQTLLIKVPEELREQYIRNGKIWHPTEVAKRDITVGPQSELAVPPEQEVTCRYLEQRKELKGYAPKFQCKIEDSGQIVLVKYKSRETFAEIAASRLLWALGFYADTNYPVKIKCLACPEKNPFQPSEEEKRVDRIIDDAIIEKIFPAEIGTERDEGWKWKELSGDDERRAQIDALKLLAVFIQHTDSKREQQRLGCYSENIQQSGTSGHCEQPVLMLQDVGATFGKGGPEVTSASSMSFNDWKRVKIWNEQKEQEFKAEHPDRKVCFGNLRPARFVRDSAITHPEISEVGRQFLANLLNQLSDQQIHDLFRVARVDRLRETTEENGVKKPVTIEDWVAVFKEKRQQINQRKCS